MFVFKNSSYLIKYAIHFSILKFKRRSYDVLILPLQLLILIASRPDSRDVRNVIRTTWLQQVRDHHLPVRHVFLVGRAPTWTLRRLREEQERHQDLVVFNFRDTYQNLTRKTLLGLDWAWQRCPQAQYVMKADDDTYVNVTNILNLLNIEVHSRPYMVGSVRSMRAPNRVKGQKYYVSKTEYTPSFYPSYCDGASYIIPTSMARDVVRVTKEGFIKPVLTLEDVHVGRCVGQLGYGFRHRNGLNVNPQFALQHLGLLCSSTVASVHPVTMEELVGIWNNCTRTAPSRGPDV